MEQLLTGEGLTSYDTKSLTLEAARMRTFAKRFLPQPGMSYVSPPPIPDFEDAFGKRLMDVINKLSAKEETRETERLQKAIDGSYATPTLALLSLIPDELKVSRAKLEEAVTAFARGDKDIAVLSTREAWEACVNYALSQLPPNPKLQRDRDKAKYVWSQVGKQDSSGLFVEVKNLFEGAFLHMIEGTPKVTDPEVPFFISVTVGFVHLVSETIAKSNK